MLSNLFGVHGDTGGTCPLSHRRDAGCMMATIDQKCNLRYARHDRNRNLTCAPLKLALRHMWLEYGM